MHRQWWIGKRRLLIFSTMGDWAWWDSTFRFNGGGYGRGAAPYVERQIGYFRLRRYL